ncbi:MAG: TRAP transporter small permease [Epsilonproteobacteria bacterium]|nr:TRAP transporter small permease [Campylobacterota bacterium]
MINQIIKRVESLSKVGAYLSALLLSIMVLLIFINILYRSLFHSSILITDEYSAYLFVGVVTFALAFTLKEGVHIKITVLSSALGKKAAKLLSIAATAIALFISLIILYFSTAMVYQSFSLDIRADTVAQTKLFIPQLFITIGFFLFSLELFAMLLKKLQ